MIGAGEQLGEPDVANGGAHQTSRPITNSTAIKDDIIKHLYKPANGTGDAWTTNVTRRIGHRPHVADSKQWPSPDDGRDGNPQNHPHGHHCGWWVWGERPSQGDMEETRQAYPMADRIQPARCRLVGDKAVGDSRGSTSSHQDIALCAWFHCDSLEEKGIRCHSWKRMAGGSQGESQLEK